MGDVSYTIERVLPHARPMILLDEVIGWTPQSLTAAVTIRKGQLFFRAEGIPAHIAIEYMAQACGAFAGIEALQSGQAPRIGLLLGTRNFSADRKWFREGERLRIVVDVVYREDAMGVFDCLVENDVNDDRLASARLTVYQPVDASDIGSMNG